MEWLGLSGQRLLGLTCLISASSVLPLGRATASHPGGFPSLAGPPEQALLLPPCPGSPPSSPGHTPTSFPGPVPRTRSLRTQDASRTLCGDMCCLLTSWPAQEGHWPRPHKGASPATTPQAAELAIHYPKAASLHLRTILGSSLLTAANFMPL